ncbi:MAG: hypothetical protein AAGF66_15890 [Cyanobacteria bacterium P01_H01_bin.119]
MKLATRKKQLIWGLGLSVLGSAVIGGTLGIMSHHRDQPGANKHQADEPQILVEGSPDFDTVVVEAAPNRLGGVPGASDPAILNSTGGPARASAIASGRSDPFSLPYIPATPTAAASTERSAGSGQTSAGNGAPAAPAASVAPSQSISLIPLPPPPSLSSLPPLPTANPPAASGVAPSAAPTATVSVPQASPSMSVADQISVTGVVELGDRVSAIIQVPNEGSRYAQVGERIASGQVLVKRIDVSNRQEPVVILEFNGREYSKIVGGASLADLM